MAGLFQKDFMHPKITDIKITSATTEDSNDGVITLIGLAPNRKYTVSLHKGLTPLTHTDTTNEIGELNIKGLATGRYSDLVITDEETFIDEEKTIKPRSQNPYPPIRVMAKSKSISSGPGNAIIAPEDPLKQILEAYFSNSKGANLRDAILKAEDVLIKELKNIKTEIPASKSVLELVLPGVIRQIQNISSSMLTAISSNA